MNPMGAYPALAGHDLVLPGVFVNLLSALAVQGQFPSTLELFSSGVTPIALLPSLRCIFRFLLLILLLSQSYYDKMSLANPKFFKI